jgi:hypothetical protein
MSDFIYTLTMGKCTSKEIDWLLLAELTELSIQIIQKKKKWSDLSDELKTYFLDVEKKKRLLPSQHRKLWHKLKELV